MCDFYFRISQLIYYRYDRFWLHNPWIWRRSAAGKKAKKALEILHGFTENVIRERKLARQEAKLENSVSDFDGLEGKRKRMFIDLLLDECDSQKAWFTDVQLRDEINTFMFEVLFTLSFYISCIRKNIRDMIRQLVQ